MKNYGITLTRVNYTTSGQQSFFLGSRLDFKMRDSYIFETLNNSLTKQKFDESFYTPASEASRGVY